MSPARTFSRIWNVSPATLDELRREFDSAFNSVSRTVREPQSAQAPMALWEDDDHVVLEFEVPGISEDNVDVQIEAGVLTVSANRVVPGRTGTLKHNEHRYGEFQRRVRLDDSLDPTSVEADLQNGILTLAIKRRVEAQPVKVAVRVRDRASDAQSHESLPGSTAPDSAVDQ